MPSAPWGWSRQTSDIRPRAWIHAHRSHDQRGPATEYHDVARSYLFRVVAETHRDIPREVVVIALSLAGLVLRRSSEKIVTSELTRARRCKWERSSRIWIGCIPLSGWLGRSYQPLGVPNGPGTACSQLVGRVGSRAVELTLCNGCQNRKHRTPKDYLYS